MGSPSARSVAARPRACRLAALVALLAAAGACRRAEFTVEGRETPIHVWLTAPEAAARGDTLDLLVSVGAQRVLDGPVRFPVGVPNVILPAVYDRAGKTRVSVVLGDGRASAEREVSVGCETWVRATITDGTVEIESFTSEPCAPRGSLAPPPPCAAPGGPAPGAPPTRRAPVRVTSTPAAPPR